MAELMATGGFIGAAAPGGSEHGHGAAMRLTQQHSWPGAVSHAPHSRSPHGLGCMPACIPQPMRPQVAKQLRASGCKLSRHLLLSNRDFGTAACQGCFGRVAMLCSKFSRRETDDHVAR